MARLTLLSSLVVLMGCSSLFYHPTKNLYFVDPHALNPAPEIIKFKTLDGLELEGWYFQAREQKPKGLLLHFHGNAQNISSHFSYLASAVQLGYDYFVFDYRGYGNSEGSPTPPGLIEDSRAAYKWAEAKIKERGDPALIYFCQSLGSAVCLRAISEGAIPSPDVLVLDSGFTSYRSVARSVAQSTWLLWAFQPLAWVMVDNSKAPKGSLSSIQSQVTLVVHGDKDRVVSQRHGISLYEELPNPKEFWSIPSGGHCDFLFREGGKYHARFFAWLENTLRNLAVEKQGLDEV